MKLRDFNFVSLPNTPKRMLTISAVISSTSSSSSSIAFLRVPSFEIIYEFAGVTQYCSLVTESTSPQSTLNNNSNENDDDKLDEDGSTILWYTDIEQGYINLGRNQRN